METATKQGQTRQKRPWVWTPQKYKAALLVAENDLSQEKISVEVDVARETLRRWIAEPEFQQQVGDYIGEIQAGMLKLSIAKKHVRLKELDTLKQKLFTVLEERGEELDGQSGGAGTGVIVKRIKAVGTGQNQTIVEEFEVDAGTIKTIMSLHEQAARELGQWVDKSQVETETRVVEVVGVDPDAFR